MMSIKGECCEIPMVDKIMDTSYQQVMGPPRLLRGLLGHRPEFMG
jgi:hypothetical protein